MTTTQTETDAAQLATTARDHAAFCRMLADGLTRDAQYSTAADLNTAADIIDKLTAPRCILPANGAPYHYYFSSLGEWRTCKPVDFQATLAAMNNSTPGYVVVAWLVPGAETVNYKINNYAPQVDGAVIVYQCVAPERSRRSYWLADARDAVTAINGDDSE